jgi:hypothetical protein
MSPGYPPVRREVLLVGSLTLLALVIRLGVFAATVDMPGDATTRAIGAYAWSKKPAVYFHGVWLPAFRYAAGLFSLAVEDPKHSSRLLNVIIGTATIPTFYGLIRAVHGASPALLATCLLTVLPLHVGLSASSQPEASFLLSIVAGTLLLIGAARSTSRRGVRLACGLFFLLVAEATRYEAWVFAPVVIGYYFFTTRAVSTSILIALVLATVPVGWTVGNYLESGRAFIGFSAAARATEEGATAVGVFTAMRAIAYQAKVQLGWLLPLAALSGALIELVRIVRRRSDAGRVLYLGLLALYWIGVLQFSMSRGGLVWSRYFLFGFATLLPLAAIPFERYVGQRVGRIVLYLVLMLAPLALSVSYYRPDVNVTRDEPTAIKDLAAWLRTSPYRDHAMIVTRMDWYSSYLPVYFPEAYDRIFVFHFWKRDQAVVDFFRKQRPYLLITSAEDGPYQARIEALLRMKLGACPVVHAQGDITVFDVTGCRGRPMNE